MTERRLEPRLLCADLVEVHWDDATGRPRRALANLEDISNSGACLQLDKPLPQETLVRLRHPKIEVEGNVRYCVFRDTGYFVGVRFAPGFKWSRRQFRPKHLFDPRTLIEHDEKRTVKKAGDQ